MAQQENIGERPERIVVRHWHSGKECNKPHCVMWSPEGQITNLGEDIISIDGEQPERMPTTEDIPVYEKPVGMMWESREGLLKAIREYISHLETSMTSDVCLCMWRKHPEDAALPLSKARKFIVDHNEECPVHSAEGRVLGFFTWVTRDPEQDAAKVREREAAVEKERLEKAASFGDVITGDDDNSESEAEEDWWSDDDGPDVHDEMLRND